MPVSQCDGICRMKRWTGIHSSTPLLMGGVTGVAGGTIRDVLLAQFPIVLRAVVYATAALAGAAVVVVGRTLGLPKTLTALAGVSICFLLQMISVVPLESARHGVALELLVALGAMAVFYCVRFP